MKKWMWPVVLLLAAVCGPLPGGRVVAVAQEGASQGRGSRIALSKAAANRLCQPWQPVASPGGVLLRAVAPLSATDVWAVGDNGQSGMARQPVIEHWNGRAWRRAAGTQAGPDGGTLVAAVALSPHDLWAVGNSTGGDDLAPLIEHGDGVGWRVVPLPRHIGALYGVAATSAHDVWAVGTTNTLYRAGSDMMGQALILHWNGTTWTTLPDTTQGGENSTLYGVAALAADDVWAVGRTGPNPDQGLPSGQPIAEHWDGKAWSLVPTPQPEGLTNDRFYAVAVLAPNDVWAVGATGDPRVPDRTLVAHWDGSGWQAIPSPNPDVEENAFMQVAAVSAHDLWFVERAAQDPSSAPPNVVHWDGKTWTVLPGPGPRALGIISAGDIWGVGAGITHYHGPLCTVDPIVSRTSAGPSASDLLLDEGTHHAFVLGYTGTVALLDTRSPAPTLVRTITLPSTPQHGFALGGPLGNHQMRGALVDHQSRRLFVVDSANDRVDVLDTVSGTVPRSTRVGIDPRAIALATAVGRVFVLNRNVNEQTGQALGPGSVTVLDAVDGHVVQTLAVGRHPWVIAVAERTGHVFVSDDSGIQMLPLGGHTSGELARVTIPLTTVVGLAVDEPTGHLFAAYYPNPPSSPFQVAMIDSVTGTTINPSLLAPGQALYYFDSLTVGQRLQRLYVASEDNGGGNQVAILETTSGHLVSTVDVPLGPHAVAVDEQTGRLFVGSIVHGDYMSGAANGNGAVSVLDARTGSMLESIPMGPGPGPIAVNQLTHRLYVLSGPPSQLPAWQPSAPSDVVLTAIHSDATPATFPRQATPADAVPASGSASPAVRYFPHTRHSLAGAFLAYWQRYGGLATFGYPRSEPFVENARWGQYTDRFLLEMVQGQIQPAPLGRLLTAQRTFASLAAFRSSLTRQYVAQTRHSLSGRFLIYWRTHHGATLLGAPIAEPTDEPNGDGSGRTYLVQWFENGRLEYHRELTDPRYQVELGLAGKQALRQRGWLP